MCSCVRACVPALCGLASMLRAQDRRANCAARAGWPRNPNSETGTVLCRVASSASSSARNEERIRDRRHSDGLACVRVVGRQETPRFGSINMLYAVCPCS